MNTRILYALGAAFVAIGGCGDGRLPEPESFEELPGLHAELRLMGVNNPDYSAVLVQVRRLTVTTPEGAALPVRLEARRAVELTTPGHAHLVGRFVVPEGVERVAVEVEFDDFGGWEQGGSGGVLDMRVAPLRFEAPVDYLTRRGRAVVHLDLEQSLVALGEGKLLQPALDVRH